MVNIPKMQIFLFFGCDYIYPSRDEKKLNDILNSRANELIRKTSIICLLLIAAVLEYTFYPAYLFVTERQIPSPIPVILPFVNPDTNTGIYLGLLNQLFIAFVGIIGNFAVEIGASITTNSMWAASDVIKYRLDELGLSAKNHEDPKVLKAKLRNILVQIQDLDR